MQTVHVAVAVIINSEQQVLLSLRQTHQHQGGLWEFPGGKVDSDESVFDALAREIAEELGLTIEHASPLAEVSHHYADKSVLLDVWQVNRYLGKPSGREGQQIRWCAISELNEVDFPAANNVIVEAVQSMMSESEI